MGSRKVYLDRGRGFADGTWLGSGIDIGKEPVWSGRARAATAFELLLSLLACEIGGEVGLGSRGRPVWVGPGIVWENCRLLSSIVGVADVQLLFRCSTVKCVHELYNLRTQVQCTSALTALQIRCTSKAAW